MLRSLTQRPRTIALGALVLLLAAGGIAVGMGHMDHGSHGDKKAATGSGAAVDLAFVQEMLPHHESALDMAAIAKERSDRPEIERLADAIITTQRQEISQLRAIAARLEGDGVRAGSLGVPHHMMGMDGDVAALETADPFDRAFLDDMVPHHQGALEMSRVVLDRGSDPEVRALATAISSAQAKEIEQMQGWRADWYGGAADASAMPGHSG